MATEHNNKRNSDRQGPPSAESGTVHYDGLPLDKDGSDSLARGAGGGTLADGPAILARRRQARGLGTESEVARGCKSLSSGVHRRNQQTFHRIGSAFSTSVVSIRRWMSDRMAAWGWQKGYQEQHNYHLTLRMRRQPLSVETDPTAWDEDGLRADQGFLTTPMRRPRVAPMRRRRQAGAVSVQDRSQLRGMAAGEPDGTTPISLSEVSDGEPDNPLPVSRLRPISQPAIVRQHPQSGPAGLRSLATRPGTPLQTNRTPKNVNLFVRKAPISIVTGLASSATKSGFPNPMALPGPVLSDRRVRSGDLAYAGPTFPVTPSPGNQMAANRYGSPRSRTTATNAPAKGLVFSPGSVAPAGNIATRLPTQRVISATARPPSTSWLPGGGWALPLATRKVGYNSAAKMGNALRIVRPVRTGQHSLGLGSEVTGPAGLGSAFSGSAGLGTAVTRPVNEAVQRTIRTEPSTLGMVVNPNPTSGLELDRRAIYIPDASVTQRLSETSDVHTRQYSAEPDARYSASGSAQGKPRPGRQTASLTSAASSQAGPEAPISGSAGSEAASHVGGDRNNQPALPRDIGENTDAIGRGKSPAANRDPNLLRRLHQQEDRRASNRQRTGGKAAEPFANPTENPQNDPALQPPLQTEDTEKVSPPVNSGNINTPAEHSRPRTEKPIYQGGTATPAPGNRDLQSNDPSPDLEEDTPSAQPINTLRQPEAMSRGLSTRLGNLLYWRASGLPSNVSEITVLRSQMPTVSGVIEEPSRWATSELSPTAADREGQASPPAERPPRVFLAHPALGQEVPSGPAPSAMEGGGHAARQNPIPSENSSGGEPGSREPGSREPGSREPGSREPGKDTDNGAGTAPGRKAKLDSDNRSASADQRESKRGPRVKQVKTGRQGKESTQPANTAPHQISALTDPEVSGRNYSWRQPSAFRDPLGSIGGIGRRLISRIAPLDTANKPPNSLEETAGFPKRGNGLPVSPHRSDLVNERSLEVGGDTTPTSRKSWYVFDSLPRIPGISRSTTKKSSQGSVTEENPLHVAVHQAGDTGSSLPDVEQSVAAEQEVSTAGQTVKAILRRPYEPLSYIGNLVLRLTSHSQGVNAAQQAELPAQPISRRLAGVAEPVKTVSGKRASGTQPQGDIPPANGFAPESTMRQHLDFHAGSQTAQAKRPAAAMIPTHATNPETTSLRPVTLELRTARRGRRRWHVPAIFSNQRRVVATLSPLRTSLSLSLLKPVAGAETTTTMAADTTANQNQATVSGGRDSRLDVLRSNPKTEKSTLLGEPESTGERGAGYPYRFDVVARPSEPALSPDTFTGPEYVTKGPRVPFGVLRRAYRFVLKGRDMVLRHPEIQGTTVLPGSSVGISPAEYTSEPGPVPMATLQRATGGSLSMNYLPGSSGHGGTNPPEGSRPEVSAPGARVEANTAWGLRIPQRISRQGSFNRVEAYSRRSTMSIPGQPDLPRRPASSVPTMAELLDSVNRVPLQQDIPLRDSLPGSMGTAPVARPAPAAGGAFGSKLVLRRQSAATDSTAAATPEPAAAPAPPAQRQSRSERAAASSRSTSSRQAPEPAGREMTDLKGWELEFLASKVYVYLQRRLDIERERHGRPGFNPWL